MQKDKINSQLFLKRKTEYKIVALERAVNKDEQSNIQTFHACIVLVRILR